MEITKQIEKKYVLKSFYLGYYHSSIKPFSATVSWISADDDSEILKLEKDFETLDEAREYLKEEVGMEV